MDRPNLVLIVMDTVRARNLRAYGYGRETTPHLDRFLAEATVYRDATSPSPWTLPAHASMFTGRMPSQHGAHENHRFLDAEVPHLAELLRVAGYETVGLSSNSWISNTFGTSRGFERFFKVWQLVQSDQDLHRVHVEDQWQKWRETVAQLTGRDFFRNLANGVYQRFLADGYDKVGRRIGRWVRRWAAERDGKRPFFLFVNLMEAHLKYTRLGGGWVEGFVLITLGGQPTQVEERYEIKNNAKIDPAIFLPGPYRLPAWVGSLADVYGTPTRIR